MPTAVFEKCDELFELLGKLVARPGKGEAPAEVKDRDGLPVVVLVGDDQEALADDLGRFLTHARPLRVPHETVVVSRVSDKVRSQRRDLMTDGIGWARAETYRRMLVELAQEFSSPRNPPDTRVEFRRFGLVNWLLESSHTRQGLDDPHERRLMQRLRDREVLRGRLWEALRSPGSEVLANAKIPWWAKVLAFYVFPAAWFRAWRLLGPEYRWLLRQPYMAPGDPGTFAGFALRLAQPRKERENPDQISKLMINAFLADLRSAYRRRFWRRRAWRRTTYCVAFLKGVTEDNCGNAFIRSLIDVRNETGLFDPLLLVASTPATRYRGPVAQPDPERAYKFWWVQFEKAGRRRRADDWYLPLQIRNPLTVGSTGFNALVQQVEAAQRFEVPDAPRWSRRGVTVGAFALVAVLAGCGGLVALDSSSDWKRAHCDLSRSDPDAHTLRREVTGECVGIAPHGYAFGIPDEDVRRTLATIAKLNAEAEQIHHDSPRRPVVTLVHISALLGGGGRQYAREALQGVASAQRRQLDKNGETDPVLRILPASAGSGMRFGPTVVDLVAELMRDDPTIVGVTGLDQSRQATITTIHAITRIGLPMVATTLSADVLADQSPLYYQVGPQNRREAAIAVAYAEHLAKQRLIQRSVRVVYSSDPTDEYSKNLRADADTSFKAAGFAVQDVPFVPSPAPAGLTGVGARSVGEAACGYPGLMFFAGRSEDFAKVLEGANDVCGSTPPRILGGDDVARFAADPQQRTTFPRVPFEFLDFTPGTASCDSASDLYSTLRELFPEECEKVKNSSLDGHAALAFDAVNLFLKAIGQLQDSAPGLPLTPAAVWHGLSAIHGKSALDGESGKIDFGGRVDQHVPVDKLVSVQHIDGRLAPRQVGFCGKRGGQRGSAWCPPG
ncbi:hypothetical protein ACFTSF_10520 [Kribbella sp. NPDC056951]|uniref:hypothetical protein n=1 Tax=Kribbella sp. NPDC056951 TaxID=3345978 RepID=UPI00363B7D52